MFGINKLKKDLIILRDEYVILRDDFNWLQFELKNPPLYKIGEEIEDLIILKTEINIFYFMYWQYEVFNKKQNCKYYLDEQNITSLINKNKENKE